MQSKIQILRGLLGVFVLGDREYAHEYIHDRFLSNVLRYLNSFKVTLDRRHLVRQICIGKSGRSGSGAIQKKRVNH